VRTAALLALSIERTDRVFFAKHVLDPHPDARLTVVHALARIDAPWSGELLLCAASTDPVPAVRRAAMTALDPDIEDHAEFLVKALDDVDIASRVAASRVLGSSQQGAAMAISSGILEKPASAEGIYFSASALASQVELLSASAYLLEALSDPRENIRLTGLVALTASGARLDGLDDLASDPEDSVKVAWCRMTRTSSSSDRDLRVSVLEQILDGESPMEAMLAMAEEGLYDSVRNLVWWRLKSGSVSDQRYVLAHASHPFGDPALAIAGMQSPDPTVRLTAAASWLTR
jgi:hypothetical protein